MNDLPNEIIYEIALLLDGEDIISFLLTSKEILNVIGDDVFWKKKLTKDYPNIKDIEYNCKSWEIYRNLEIEEDKLIPIYYNDTPWERDRKVKEEIRFVKYIHLTRTMSHDDLTDKLILLLKTDVKESEKWKNRQGFRIEHTKNGKMFIDTSFMKGYDGILPLDEYPGDLKKKSGKIIERMKV